MKNNSLILFLFTFFCLFTAAAQPGNNNEVEMADRFYSEGKVFVVVVVVSIVVIGMVAYLFLMDRKLTRLEKEMKNKKH